ncbi:MAG: ComEA family DNA-binding protein, partial [Deltaproteobacteria bacterium]
PSAARPRPPSCDVRVELTSGVARRLVCGAELAQPLSRACPGLVAPAALRDGDSLALGPGCRLERGRMSGPALRLLGLPVDVNRASVEDLEALPGIGPRLAARLVAGRPFRDPSDLARVSGIGARRLATLSAAVELGAPWIEKR